jgi:hypothetical protein
MTPMPPTIRARTSITLATFAINPPLTAAPVVRRNAVD